MQAKFSASLIGAMIAVAPFILFCLIAISGAVSTDPLDDAPQKGAALFLVFGIPVIFLCSWAATAIAVFLFKQKFVLSVHRLLLVSLVAPPVIVVISTYFFAYDPVTVLTQDTATLLVEAAAIAIFLGAGLLGSRWWLKRELKRTTPSTAATAT